MTIRPRRMEDLKASELQSILERSAVDILVTSGVPFLDWTPPAIAWPWYVVIGGTVNIAVSWIASVLLDGFRTEWHEQTVPGQIRRFRELGLPVKDGGWYLVPGRVDATCWLLLVFFVLSITFLAAFASFGARP